MIVKVTIEGWGMKAYQVSDEQQKVGDEEKKLFADVGTMTAQILEKARMFGPYAKMHIEIFPDSFER